MRSWSLTIVVPLLGALSGAACSFDAGGVSGGGDAGGPADASADGSVASADAGADAGEGGADAMQDGPDAGPSCDFASDGEGGCWVPSNLPAGFDHQSCLGGAPAIAGASAIEFTVSGQTPTISCTGCDGGVTSVAGQVVSQAAADGDVAVFCVSSIDLPAEVTWTAAADFGAPIVILSGGDVTIDGSIDVSGRSATSTGAGAAGPGGFPGGGLGADEESQDGQGPCAGLGGEATIDDFFAVGSGGGGGGFGGMGARGGDGNHDTDPIGGQGGGVCGDPALVPLAGGSGGGSGADGSCGGDCGWPGGGGGGAIQIASGTQIAVSGGIASRGGDGYGYGEDGLGDLDVGGAGGGGSGGAILLEAPAITLGGALVVDGGDGGCDGDGDPEGTCDGPGSGGNDPDPDGDGQVVGAGATGTFLAGEPGGDANDANRDGGGGGGGGGGRIRLNGAATCSGASPADACSTGALQTAP